MIARRISKEMVKKGRELIVLICGSLGFVVWVKAIGMSIIVLRIIKATIILFFPILYLLIILIYLLIILNLSHPTAIMTNPSLLFSIPLPSSNNIDLYGCSQTIISRCWKRGIMRIAAKWVIIWIGIVKIMWGIMRGRICRVAAIISYNQSK